MSVVKKLNIARAVFATLSMVLALITLITFGANMDAANFPGSSLVLDTYSSEDDPDREGQLKQVFGGFEIKEPTKCRSFYKGDLTAAVDDTNPCARYNDATDEYEPIALEESPEGTTPSWRGWVVAPACYKTADTGDCAPFGYSAPLSGFGAATFATFAIRAVLFGAHTCVMLLSEDVSVAKAMASKGQQRLFLGLNIVWTIVSFVLFVWAALAWQGMCDKIDTGLGRFVDVGDQEKQACATSYCNISFGGFFASYAVAISFFRIPNILIWAGIVDGSDEQKYSQIDDDE